MENSEIVILNFAIVLFDPHKQFMSHPLWYDCTIH
jgi:hypothetical protein